MVKTTPFSNEVRTDNEQSSYSTNEYPPKLGMNCDFTVYTYPDTISNCTIFTNERPKEKMKSNYSNFSEKTNTIGSSNDPPNLRCICLIICVFNNSYLVSSTIQQIQPSVSNQIPDPLSILYFFTIDNYRLSSTY